MNKNIPPFKYVDIQHSRSRRLALARLGIIGMAGLATGPTAAGGNRAAALPSAPGSCILIPEETPGPYPLRAMLSNPVMMRKDVREDRKGIPLTLAFRLQDVGNACRPIAGAAIYIWHCDKDGGYSGYSNPQNGNHAGQTYLRGIQLTDAGGTAVFTTIFPGWYAGRITHIHFQVYLDNRLAATATATSQLAFPQEITKAVYATPLYRSRGQNPTVASFSEDGVFSDGVSYQLANVSGNPQKSLRASLTVGIAIR